MRWPVAILVVLVLAGCGGDQRLSKREYVHRMQALAREGYRRALRSWPVFLCSRAAPRDERLRELGRLVAYEREYTQTLRTLRPPSEVARWHRDLVAEARDRGREYAAALARAEAGARVVVPHATARDLELLARADARLYARGYFIDVGTRGFGWTAYSRKPPPPPGC